MGHATITGCAGRAAGMRLSALPARLLPSHFPSFEMKFGGTGGGAELEGRGRERQRGGEREE